MLLLVNKFKMIGMLLNVVHGQVQKSEQKHITKESNGFHNHSMIKMNVNELRNTSLHSPSPPPPYYCYCYSSSYYYYYYYYYHYYYYYYYYHGVMFVKFCVVFDVWWVSHILLYSVGL